LAVQNLELLESWLGSGSEAHFFLLTTELEWRGAPCIVEIVRIIQRLGHHFKGMSRVE